MSEIRDVRFVGFLDRPPEGMTRKMPAMRHSGYDIWANDKSIFSPAFRWALVPRRTEVRP